MALGVAELGNCLFFPFHHMARAALISHRRTLALLDARKQRLYGQLFDTSEVLPKPLTDASDSDLADLIPKELVLRLGVLWCILTSA